MPVALIKPDKHLRVKYRVPSRGSIDYYVEADRPVTTFIVDKAGLEEFYDKGTEEVTSYYGGFPHRKVHDEQIRLPFKGDLYLLIINDDDKNPVAVFYSVDA